MSARSGIAAQFGCAIETTVGTRVTVTSFYPLVSESIKRSEAFTESEGIRAGRLVMTSDMWNSGNVTIAGDIALELNTKSIRPLLQAAFGTETATSTGGGIYTYTPGDLFGTALTVQIGRPGVDGTVRPFTYGGTKIMSWEIACAAGEIATLGLTVQNCLVDETTGVTLATASYTTSQKAFKFSGATLTIAGSTVDVKQLTLSGDNALEGRLFNGSQYSKEPIQTGLRVYGGSVQPEFTDLTLYNRFVNHTEAALVTTFTSGTDTLVVTENVRFDGETPNVGGRGIVDQPLPFTAVASTSSDASAITAVYTSV
jgi:hypothetical protein